MGTRTGVTEYTTQSRDGRWLGRDLHGLDIPKQGTLTLAGLDAAHYFDGDTSGTVRDGVPVAIVGGRFVIYDASEADGSEVLFGFILDPSTPNKGADKVVCTAYFHGGIVLAHTTVDGNGDDVAAADLPALLWEA